MKHLLVLVLCALVTAGCSGSDDHTATAPGSQSTPTTTEAGTETTRAPDTDTTPPRTYREVMERLPPLDEPASPEVAAWRKATISALLDRCGTTRGGASKASFVRANRNVLAEAGHFPGARLVKELSIAGRDGNGCPKGSGPATYYTTNRTYRLPAGTTPARVFAHYERELYGWFEAEIRACEHTYGQGPAYVAVSACNGFLRVSVRARAPVEAPRPALLPARPFGAQYPLASGYATAPQPRSQETKPGATCERVSGVDAPSVIVPPPPGIRASIEGGKVVVHWTLGTVHGDCPPSELILSYPAPAPHTIQEAVHAASGVTRMRLLHGVPRPKEVTAKAVSVDGPRSRAVAVLVSR